MSGYTFVKILLFIIFSALFTYESSAKVTKGVWWWRGEDVKNVKVFSKRLQFLSSRGVDEIYLCVDLKKFSKETRSFVKAARAKGMRVAFLSGDVSWIRPGNRGFAEVLETYLSYQRRAAKSERFYAIHLDVEPHQDPKLSESRKWQLYADFVLRAAADIHAAGEKVEWDIPFWLDNILVEYGEKKGVSLLEVVMEASDCVALMSYRDTAQAILDISKGEIAFASKGKTRVVLGAETGETGEGDFVTFFEEGEKTMQSELSKVVHALEEAKLPYGAGVAVHHLKGWENFTEKEDAK